MTKELGYTKSRSSHAQAYGLIPVEGATSPEIRPACHRLKRYEPEAVDVKGCIPRPDET